MTRLCLKCWFFIMPISAIEYCINISIGMKKRGLHKSKVLVNLSSYGQQESALQGLL